MKTLHILAIFSLVLGLSQTANAAHEMGHEDTQNWQSADTNKDGVISKDEFMAKHQERAEKMFTKMDANKDGKIEESERKAMRKMCDHTQK